MGWLFGQVWMLCAVAFLAGAGVTWLAFVRPARGSVPVDVPPRPPSAWPATPPPAARAEPVPHTVPPPPPAPPPAQPPVEPALAALDTRGTEPSARRPGTAAADALDRLGVTGPPPEPTPPSSARIDVPQQRVSGNEHE